MHRSRHGGRPGKPGSSTLWCGSAASTRTTSACLPLFVSVCLVLEQLVGTRVAAMRFPAFVCHFLLDVSRVTLLQKAAKQYGSDAGYLDCATRTSHLIQWVPKRKL